MPSLGDQKKKKKKNVITSLSDVTSDYNLMKM